MSVFLTPDGRPFYGGTYYPPRPRYGMPSFAEVLRAIAAAWTNRRDELLAGADRVLGAVRAAQGLAAATAGQPAPDLATVAFRRLSEAFDERHAGWGAAPKFPQPMALEFLLQYQYAFGDTRALEMVTRTLEAMARGGMYDQVGGGFHRYSVDDRWLVPHFEKMLYDNAQLARVYLHAWQVTGRPLFRAVTEEILEYVIREMVDPGGGFYSTQDADSEGIEGKYFLWTPTEVQAELGWDATRFLVAYGVEPGGNFEGKSILEFRGDEGERDALSGARRKLLRAREARVPPSRDEKVITSWNGLMLAAFAEAARVLERDDYRAVAERNAGFLLREMTRGDDRLFHVWSGGEGRYNAYLEDHAFLVEGLLQLYQSTFEVRWFDAARALADSAIVHFRAPDGGFYDTSDDHEPLVVRPRDLQDNATPSGSAAMAASLASLSLLAHEDHYAAVARDTIARIESQLREYPLASGKWLQAHLCVSAAPREIAIVGDPEAADTASLLGVVQSRYHPFQVLAAGDESNIPVLDGKQRLNGRAAAYVCVGLACRQPIAAPVELARVLDE
jgi:uncharacterized protein YyaL (SSP411 family)